MSGWLDPILNPITKVVFVVGDDHVTWAELFGLIFGVICIALAVRAMLLNYPVGILSAVMFALLFYWARLWADTGLQLMFITLGFVGWYQWIRGKRPQTPLLIRPSSPLFLAGGVLLTAVLTAGLTPILGAADDSSPFLDSLTTSLSVTGQLLLNIKRIENWWFWVAASVIYFPLYLSRHLLLTAWVDVLVFVLYCAGYLEWRRRLTRSRTPAASVGLAPV
jgi:nicotinamide mononucleotide transporter